MMRRQESTIAGLSVRKAELREVRELERVEGRGVGEDEVRSDLGDMEKSK